MNTQRDKKWYKRIFESVTDRKWILPLILFVFVLGFFSPVKTVYAEFSWFDPGIHQVIVPAIFVCLIMGGVGAAIGLIADKYGHFLTRKRIWILAVLAGITVFFLIRGVKEIALVAFLLILIAELAIKENAFSDIYADILLGITIGLLVQTCVLNRELGMMNSSPEWETKSGQAVMSSLCWIIALMLPAVIRLLVEGKSIRWTRLAINGSVLISIIAVNVQLFSGISTRSITWDISNEGEFSLSNEENIIVFLIDQLDEKLTYNYVCDEFMGGSPEDFTLFDNVVSPTSSSVWNVSALLTGKIYDGYEEKNMFFNEAYDSSDLFKELKNNGFDVQVYIDKTILTDNTVIDAPQWINNLVYTDRKKISSYSLFIKNIIKLTGYYTAPYKLKKYFMFDTRKADENLRLPDGKDIIMDSSGFLDNIEAIGLTDESINKRFMVYYLKGGSAAFSAVSDYIGDLKEQGLYDKSTIIVMGASGQIGLRQNPMVLIKNKSEHKRFSVNNDTAGFDNIRASIVEGLKTDVEYGNNLFEIDESKIKEARMVIVQEDIRNEYYSEQERIDSPTRFLIGGEAMDESRIYEAPIPGIYDYTLGEEIRFFGENVTPDIGASGLSGIETGIRWTDGTGMAMKFRIKEPYEDLQITLHFNNVYRWPQRLVFYANDKLACELTLDDWQSIEFIVPHNWAPDGMLELVMGLPDSEIPMVGGTIVDSRRLGISMDTMFINSVHTEL